MRYYISDNNGIPLRNQPKNGYTKLEAIERVQRECEECVSLFGGKIQDYTNDFYIMDNNFKIHSELQNAICQHNIKREAGD